MDLGEHGEKKGDKMFQNQTLEKNLNPPLIMILINNYFKLN